MAHSRVFISSPCSLILRVRVYGHPSLVVTVCVKYSSKDHSSLVCRAVVCGPRYKQVYRGSKHLLGGVATCEYGVPDGIPGGPVVLYLDLLFLWRFRAWLVPLEQIPNVPFTITVCKSAPSVWLVNALRVCIESLTEGQCVYLVSSSPRATSPLGHMLYNDMFRWDCPQGVVIDVCYVPVRVRFL